MVINVKGTIEEVRGGILYPFVTLVWSSSFVIISPIACTPPFLLSGLEM